MRFEDICVYTAVRYMGCPPSVLGEDPLLAGRVTARWPDSFRATFARHRNYGCNTVAADMFEPRLTGCDGAAGPAAHSRRRSAGPPVTSAQARPTGDSPKKQATQVDKGFVSNVGCLYAIRYAQPRRRRG
jgi:hypothetical protein